MATNNHLKEYKNILGSNISLFLHISSITDIPFHTDALVNCTGPRFEYNSKLFYKF